MKRIFLFTSTLLLLVACQSAPSQNSQSDNNFREQFNRHLQRVSRTLELAKAMPADTYEWRPMEGVMSVEEVYTHIARYNYLYPATSLDIPAPDDVDMEQIETITGKEQVVAALERSINHLRDAVENMPDNKFSESTELYGRTVNGQAVLLQLLTHWSEHFGQSIAYARMNGIVPPWSE